MKKLVAMIALALLCGDGLSPAPVKNRERLDNITRQIDDINTKIEDLKKEEGSILSEIYKVELQYEKAIIENNRIKLQLRNTETKIDEKNAEKEALEKEIRKSTDNIKQILRLMYKIGGNSYLKLFIRIDNLDQLFKNYQLFIQLIDYKSNEINKLKQNIQRLEAVKSELQTEFNKIQDFQRQKEQKVRDIRGIKQSRMVLIRNINNDKQQYMKMLDELEAEAARLNQLIYGRPLKRRLGLIDLDRLKGKLIWPLKGKIISYFGKKRSTKFDTYIINNGIKIKPTSSDQIKAVYPGEVVFASYYKGYGNLIIIQHAKNLYSLYGHCEKLMKEKGDPVSEGELIALAGDSGSTSGKALYFEIRTQLKPQNPLTWLRKR
jgi:murein hydrolase activator